MLQAPCVWPRIDEHNFLVDLNFGHRARPGPLVIDEHPMHVAVMRLPALGPDRRSRHELLVDPLQDRPEALEQEADLAADAHAIERRSLAPVDELTVAHPFPALYLGERAARDGCGPSRDRLLADLRRQLGDVTTGDRLARAHWTAFSRQPARPVSGD